MTCKNDKGGAVHSGLCNVDYPHKRIGSTDVQASHLRDCSLDRGLILAGDVHQTLGYEANMDLISPQELDLLLGAKAKFGTYCDLKKSFLARKSPHFCVDSGRRTVDGRRLAWLWVFPDGEVKKAHKVLDDPPPSVWTKAEVLKAWRDAGNETLSMWTRHVDTFSELAITFCLPQPSDA
jgi:hypothetical protein